MTEIEQRLRNNPNAPVLFIADPISGDKFIFGGDLHQIPIPKTADGSEITTANDLLNRLDFGTYETEPTTIVN